jgi:hypothetical protein
VALGAAKKKAPAKKNAEPEHEPAAEAAPGADES